MASEIKNLTFQEGVDISSFTENTPVEGGDPDGGSDQQFVTVNYLKTQTSGPVSAQDPNPGVSVQQVVTYNYMTATHGVWRNNDSTSAPTANDDTDDEYGPGSLWNESISSNPAKASYCADASATAAVWREMKFASNSFRNEILSTTYNSWNPGNGSNNSSAGVVQDHANTIIATQSFSVGVNTWTFKQTGKFYVTITTRHTHANAYGGYNINAVFTGTVSYYPSIITTGNIEIAIGEPTNDNNGTGVLCFMVDVTAVDQTMGINLQAIATGISDPAQHINYGTVLVTQV